MAISPALFPAVTVTVVRDRKIRTALRTTQVAGFVTVPSWKKISSYICPWTYPFGEANSFPRAKLEENCELRGTDNVQGQISEHIFAPNGGYCLYYPSNLFRNARSFENWGIFSDIPQF